MIAVRRYTPADAEAWNRFVAAAKNGHFLFDRNYMDYHADRFPDHSLLFFDDERLIAILPATQSGDALLSHAGLTHGGVISGRDMKVGTMLAVFDALAAYARANGIASALLKRIPHIYHSIPADEDLYALFRHGATLARREASSTIDMRERLPYTKGRRYCIGKSARRGVHVEQSGDFEGFMRIDEEHLLAKYGVKPTHTAEEMALLASRFPTNIRLFTASKDARMAAGVIVYETPLVAHAQYIAATREGHELSALDAIIDHLLGDVFREKRWFDFGTSTEKGGIYLNERLMENKESYGARAIVYDSYEVRF